MALHISIKAEEVFNIYGFSITNSLLMTWLVMAFLFVISLLVTSNLKKKPGRLQMTFELLIGGLYDLFHSILGGETKKYFSLLMTIFVFVIFINWFGLLPGVGTVGFYESAQKPNTVHAMDSLEDNETTANEEEIQEVQSKGASNVHQDSSSDMKEVSHENIFVPLLRAGSADLNLTIALALISVTAIQVAGLKTLGLSYLKKFINFSNPINFFVGILELVSEFSKIISFAFRLFGNIFAGEVLLTVVAFLIPIIAPIPFLGLEIFVGFIQALVFSMLTAVFLSLAVSHAEH
jgi:F-type H+-transporting ATPase subunit a